jgi:hypothetical protein
MNVAAVFAPEKVYGCPGSVAFNCVPKFQFAATTRALTDADIHGVLPRLGEVRRRDIVPMKMRFEPALSASHKILETGQQLCPRRRYKATIHGVF